MNPCQQDPPGSGRLLTPHRFALLLTLGALFVSPWPLGSWYTGPRTLLYSLAVFAVYALARPLLLGRRSATASGSFPRESSSPVSVAGLSVLGTDLWLGLPLVMLASNLWSVTPADTYERSLLWLALAALYLALSRSLSPRSGLLLGWGMAALGVGLSLYAFREYWLAPAPFPATRVSGPFSYPNSYGAYVLALTLVAVGLTAAPSRLGRTAAVLSGGLGLAATLLTGSRGTLLAAPVALVVLAWLSPRRKRTFVHLGLTFLVAGVTFVAIFFSQPGRGLPLADRVGRLRAGGERLFTVVGSSSWQGRLEFWRCGWAAFLSRPWLGWGADSYHRLATVFQRSPEWFANRLHNDYLQVLTELGLPGGLAVAGAVAGTLRTLLALAHGRQQGEEGLASLTAGAGAALALILVHSAVDLDLQFPAVALLVFLLLSLLGQRSLSRGSCWRLGGRWRAPAWGAGWGPTQTGRLAGTILPVLLLAFFLAGVLPWAGQVARERAVAAYEEGDLDRALPVAEISLALTPHHPGSLRLLAHLLQARAGSDQAYWLGRAVVLVERGVKRNPYDPYLHDLLGSLHLRSGNVPAALERFQRAVALYRWQPEFRLRLAAAYLAAGQQERALGELAFLLTHRREFSRTLASHPERLQATFLTAARLWAEEVGVGPEKR